MSDWGDVVDLLETALLVVDEADMVVLANQPTESITGVPCAAAIGRPAAEVLPHADLPGLVEALAATRLDGEPRTIRSGVEAAPRSLECRVSRAGAGVVVELWDVTNYAEAERRRREIEAAREVIWERSHAAFVVVDLVARRLDASTRVRDNWPIEGFTSDVEAGRVLQFLDCPHQVTDAWPSLTALADGRLQRAAAEVFTTGQELQYRHRLPLPDGSVRFVDTQVVPWGVADEPRGVVFVVHDYTRFVRAEQLGSAATQAIDQILASLPVQVFDLDLASGVATPIAGSVGLLGPTDEPAKLRRLTRGLPDEAQLGLWKTLELSTADTTESVTFFDPAASRWLQVSIRRLPTASFDGSPRAVVVVTDLTEQMTLLDRERKVDHASHVLRFAQGVAHDFGNVAQVIGGFAQLLAENPSPEVIAAASTRLSAAAARGVAVARRISAIARIEQVVNEPTDLSALVSTAVPHLQDLAGPGVRVYAEVAGGLVAMAEGGHVISALENLVENAVEAMEGRGAIRLGVALVTEGGRAMVEVSVSDNGPGVPTHLLDRVFDPFVTGRPTAGTGLGLYLVFEYLLSVGGRAVLTSDDQGATFRLLFPAVA